MTDTVFFPISLVFLRGVTQIYLYYLHFFQILFTIRNLICGVWMVRPNITIRNRYSVFTLLNIIWYAVFSNFWKPNSIWYSYLVLKSIRHILLVMLLICAFGGFFLQLKPPLRDSKKVNTLLNVSLCNLWRHIISVYPDKLKSPH